MGICNMHQQTRPVWRNADRIPPYVFKSTKRPASVAAGRPCRPAAVPAGKPVPAGRTNSTGWKRNAANHINRSLHHDYRPSYYDQMYMGGIPYSTWFPWQAQVSNDLGNFV